MTYPGQVFVFVVDLTGCVRVGQIPRREVKQGEVDALAWLGDQFDGTRRHAVGQSAQTARRRRGRVVAVGQDCHTAAAAGQLDPMTLWHYTTNEAQVGRYSLLSHLETLIVIWQHRCTKQYTENICTAHSKLTNSRLNLPHE